MNKDECVISESVKKCIQQISDTVIRNGSFEDVIKDGIFDLLESKCTVIYYPLENEKNRGFHIKKIVNNNLEDFVYINTDKTVEQQVFTAAHELGHILNVYEEVCAMLDGQMNLDPNDQRFEEKVIDRFAAELLMPESKFVKETNCIANELGIRNSVSVLEMLKLIARLMDRFMSPFNAVRKRLHEVNAIDEDANLFLSKEKVDLEKIINLLKKDENRLINSNTGIKTISGLRELLDEATKNPKINKSLIEKIKKDFDINDINYNEKYNIRFSGAKVD
ncbi:MAG: ImmA/IrrE family metallo-endopeptidase [Clostridiales bacterium]|nr:ImmA/IrrE family metallo-endopeptidase [Clostridiales bacterium]